MTLRLARKPKYVEMFYFNLHSEDALSEAVEAIKLCKRDLGSNVGGINIINKERCLSMLMDYPLDKIESEEPLSQAELDHYAKKFMITPWLVVGMIYGEKGNVKESKKIILKHFKNIKKNKFFFNTSNKSLASGLSFLLKKFGFKDYGNMIDKLLETYSLLMGNPNYMALRLAYWKNPNKKLVEQENLNPKRDNCGLIWYAPLVEMKGKPVTDYVQFVRECSDKFKFNALITLTTVDDLCFDSTIPILFNLSSAKESKKAYDFYQYLFTEGAAKGFFPYRLNIETQKDFNIQNPFMRIESVNPDRYK